MRHRLIGVGATVATIAAAVAFVAAQDRISEPQAGPPPVVQGPPPAGQGQMGAGPAQRGRGMQQGPGAPQQPGGRGRGMDGQGPGMGRGGPGRGALGPLGALDLTEDQRAAITDLKRASRDQAAPLENELEFVQKSLHRELFADKRDSGKITNLSARVSALQKQLADVHVKTATSVSDLLTETQRETMRLSGGREGRMGRGGGEPGRMGRRGAPGRR